MFKNWGLKILSVFIAFLIWLMVVNGDDPEKTKAFKNVPVKVVNEESLVQAGKVYSPRDGTDTVTVWVTARRSVLDKLSSADFEVIADFENIVSLEMTTIPLQIRCKTNKTLTRENMDCDPPSLKVDIEDAKEKDFIVSVITEGTPASGYEVGNMQVVKGESIKITGPESIIDIIDKVIATVPVGGKTADETVSIPLNIIDRNGKPFSESQMNNLEIKTSGGALISDQQMDIRLTMWKVKSDIKLKVETTGTPAQGYRVGKITTTPATVGLTGSDEILNSLEGELSIYDAVSLDGVTESFEKTLDLSDYLLEKYQKTLRQEANASSTISINVQIEKVGTTTLELPVTEIEIKNKPEGLNMTLTPADKVSIEAQEDTEASQENTVKSPITAKDIKATLDLSLYKTAGNYKVPLTIVVPNGYVLVSEVTMVVNLEKIETEAETLSAVGGET